MNNIEQVRESISDASYALSQVGGDVDYVALLTMRERLNRLVDLEYVLLARSTVDVAVADTLKRGEGAEREPDDIFAGCIVSAVMDTDDSQVCPWAKPKDRVRFARRTLTVTLVNGEKRQFVFSRDQ